MNAQSHEIRAWLGGTEIWTEDQLDELEARIRATRSDAEADWTAVVAEFDGE